MLRRWAALTCVLITAAACTGDASTQGSADSQTAAVAQSPIGGPTTMQVLGQNVPWVDESATPTPKATVPPNVKPCSTDDLNASLDGMEGATGGQMVGSLEFRNASDRSCSLEGHPEVHLLDSEGDVLSVATFDASTLFGPTKPEPPTWPVLLLAPGDLAHVFALSQNQCGPKVASWVIGYPDGSEARVMHEGNMGVCLYPHRQASLSIGAFEPPQTRPKWPLVPNVAAQSLRASQGEELNYVVSLYNVPNRTFEFPEPCPSYMQRIRRSGHVVQDEGLVLNCSGVGPVPGKTAVNFDMTIHIPDDLHGRYMLVWQLDPPFGYNTTIQLTVR